MKNVVITGSTRGIGFQMGLEFLKHGCNVAFSGRCPEVPEQLQKVQTEYASSFLYIPCNVQQMGELQNLWDRSKEKWGQIDIWINNAGKNAPHEFVYNTEQPYVDDILSTNIRGMIDGSIVAARGMIAQKHGAIYSMEGLGSNNMIQRKTILYGTTKHALTYFMKGLAKELKGTGVIAGRLSPGMMLTEFITKSADGNTPAIESDKSFQRIFNTLADRPETVAAYFVPKMLSNTKNNAQIIWLTNLKTLGRFLSSPITRRKIV